MCHATKDTELLIVMCESKKIFFPTSCCPSNGTLTAVRYWDEILRPTVRPHAGTTDPGFLPGQDNAWPHLVIVCRQFLDDEHIDVIDWPSHSPDLDPVETLWDVTYQCI